VKAATPDRHALTLRYGLEPDDRGRVRDLVSASGFFSPEEIEMAVDLVDERLAKGPASGYDFVFAEADGRTVGYACFGPIPATQAGYDLYWIVVAPDRRRSGLGRLLIGEVERLVRSRGGLRLYADTSGRPQYAPTRAFYEAVGYRREAVLKDFFAPGDDKLIFVKAIRDAPNPCAS
jgi:GNAT superfamily N-acetyltransferase